MQRLISFAWLGRGLVALALAASAWAAVAAPVQPGQPLPAAYVAGRGHHVALTCSSASQVAAPCTGIRRAPSTRRATCEATSQRSPKVHRS